LGGNDLGLADRSGSMNDLALQVAELNCVMVAQRELTNTARCKIERGGRTQTAQSDDQRLGVEQGLLPLDPNFIKQDVAAVPQ